MCLPLPHTDDKATMNRYTKMYLYNLKDILEKKQTDHYDVKQRKS